MGIDFGKKIFPYQDSYVLFGLCNSNVGQHDSLKIVSVVLGEKAINSFIHNGEHFKAYQRAIGSFSFNAYADFSFLSLQGQVQKEHGTNQHYEKGTVIRRVL